MFFNIFSTFTVEFMFQNECASKFVTHQRDLWMPWLWQATFVVSNVLYIYCTCVFMWGHVPALMCLRICVFVLVLSEIDRVEQLLFYLIYLWFPLSEILIPAINQPPAIEWKRNLHTHDAEWKRVCVYLSEFPGVCCVRVLLACSVSS